MVLENSRMYKPEGVFPAMQTPFDQNGNVNGDELRRLVRWLIDAGVHGLFPLGSVGEFIHLNFEQKVKVMEIATDEAKGRVPVIPSATESCVENSVRIIKKARQLGCKGVVIAPPYYYPISQEMLKTHYEQVAQAVPDMAITLYNIPIFGTDISYDVVASLSSIDNIVAMKDSSGSMLDLLHFMDKIRLAGQDLNIMVGREEMLYSGLLVGARGTMSASVGIVPELMLSIYNSVQEGNLHKAKEIQFSILKLVREMFALPFPIGFKTALELRGFKMGPPLQPMAKVDENKYKQVRANLKKILTELLEEKNFNKTV